MQKKPPNNIHSNGYRIEIGEPKEHCPAVISFPEVVDDGSVFWGTFFDREVY